MRLLKHFQAATASALVVGFLLFYAALPVLSEVLRPVVLVFLLCFALRPLLRGKRNLQWGVILLGLLTTGLALWLSNTDWLSGPTLLSVLITVLALKWVEADSDRELILLSYGALLLLTLAGLHLGGFSSLAYLTIGALLLLLALNTINHPQRSFLLRLGLVGRILLISLPVTTMLFISMPRLQGPLWDLGIVMGLPIELVIDQEEREKGIKGTLRAGQVSRLKQSDAPVLVAEFKGTVPYKSRLYWRGAVFSHYDGVSWQLPEGWDNRSNLLRTAFKGKNTVDQVLTSKEDLVSYEARVTAHGARWLYALDVPVGRSAESFVSADLQMLGIRRVSREFNYEQKAYLEYSGGRPLTDQQRQEYLQLPDNSNPRLIELGRSLGDDPVYRLQVHLASGGYQITQTPDIEEHPNSLDEFMFERKVGGIEHLAGATALVLRAAGIPTRLVAGYRGGSLIALTNFIVVRQGNAHVWVEAWIDGVGWQRVEAQDMVAKPEKEKVMQQTEAQVEKKTQPAVSKPAATEAKSAALAGQKKTKPKQSSRREKGPGWLQKLSSGLETWVLNYNPDRQVELMQKSGLRKVDWKSLLAITLVGLLLLSLLYIALLQLKRGKEEPVARSFNELNKALGKKGLACAADECPQIWLRRLQGLELPFYDALEQIVGRYMQVRYSRMDTEQGREATKLLCRDIKRLTAML